MAKSNKSQNINAKKVRGAKSAMKTATHSFTSACGAINKVPMKRVEAIRNLVILGVHINSLNVKPADIFTACHGSMLTERGDVMIFKSATAKAEIGENTYNLYDVNHKTIKKSDKVRLMSESDSTFDKDVDLYVTSDRLIDALAQWALITTETEKHLATNAAYAKHIADGDMYININESDKFAAAEWRKVSCVNGSWSIVEETEKKITKRAPRKGSAKKSA